MNSERKKDFIRGGYPAIAANSHGDLVCVYNHLLWSKVYYGVGSMVGDVAVDWKSQEYICAGDYPRVAINDNKKVVIVYTYSGMIKYCIGTITESCNSISWNKEYDVCNGKYPSVTISGDKVLLAFQVKGNCHYCLGDLVDASLEIRWNQSNIKLVENALYPSVALKNNLAVVFFNRSGSKLLSIVGEVNDSTLKWGVTQDYLNETPEASDFTGDYPSVAIFEDGAIVATFQKGASERRYLLAWCGKAQSTKKIEWCDTQATGHFMQGCYSSVTAVKSAEKGQIFIEMHSTNALGWNGIWYHVSRITT